MCQFFSCVSNGEGEVKFFKPEEVVRIMAEGNKDDLDFNSHTSLCRFNGIKGLKEDEWNKWEYNPEKKTLKKDSLVTTDDGSIVKLELDKFFKDKDILYLRNLYGRNSGYMNSGYRNSGYMNSGDRNSGYMNSGDMNSGDMNSGDMNSGYMNSGDMNSGDRNSGYRNSGYMNSGDRNSGYRNSGDRNSGDFNKTYGSSGVFCTTEPEVLFFNKPSGMTLRQWRQSEFQCLFNYFSPTEFINEADMTNQEKIDNPKFYVMGGYLKRISHEDACKKWWKGLSAAQKKQVQKIPNFDLKIFKEITGIDV